MINIMKSKLGAGLILVALTLVQTAVAGTYTNRLRRKLAKQIPGVLADTYPNRLAGRRGRQLGQMSARRRLAYDIPQYAVDTRVVAKNNIKIIKTKGKKKIIIALGIRGKVLRNNGTTITVQWDHKSLPGTSITLEHGKADEEHIGVYNTEESEMGRTLREMETLNSQSQNMVAYRRKGGEMVSFCLGASFQPGNQASHGTFHLPGVEYKYQADDYVNNCFRCNKKFTRVNRKHHCWAGCGKIVCSTCAPQKKHKNERICVKCKPEWEKHLKKCNNNIIFVDC